MRSQPVKVGLKGVNEVAAIAKVGLKGVNEVATLGKVGLKYVNHRKVSFGEAWKAQNPRKVPKTFGRCRLDRPGRPRKNRLDPKCL